MRFPFLALLSMGTVALCQSPGPQKKIDPDKLFQLPERFAQTAPNFKSLKPLPPLKHELILPHPGLITTRPNPNNPQIDPKIIVRPPGRDTPKGHDFAHHLYPNLKFLPLHRGPHQPR